jgi:hypothetical protein
VKVWDVPGGLELLTLRGPVEAGFTRVAFSPDRRRLAAAQGDRVLLWDATHDRPTAPDLQRIQHIPWAPDTPESRLQLMGAFLQTCLLSWAVLLAPAGLVAWAVRRRPWGRLRFLAVPAAAALAAGAFLLILRHATVHGRYSPFYTPFGSEVPDRLCQALLGLPIAVFPVLLLLWAVRRQWLRAGSLAGLGLLTALVIAGWALWSDPSRQDPLQQYAWDGWYFVGFAGVYAAGALTLLALLLRAVVRLVFRLRRGSVE